MKVIGLLTTPFFYLFLGIGLFVGFPGQALLNLKADLETRPQKTPDPSGPRYRDLLKHLDKDFNLDQKDDLKVYLSPQQKLMLLAQDTNFDGMADIWFGFNRQEELAYIDRDTDFDQQVDLRIVYKNKAIQTVKKDLEKRGVFNCFYDYQNDYKYVRITYDLNYDFQIDKWEFLLTKVEKREFAFSTRRRKMVETGIYHQAHLLPHRTFIDNNQDQVPDQIWLYNELGEKIQQIDLNQPGQDMHWQAFYNLFPEEKKRPVVKQEEKIFFLP